MRVFSENSILRRRRLQVRARDAHTEACSGQSERTKIEQNIDVKSVENLQKSIPAFFPRFERLIEIVESNDEDLARGRANWIYYKDRGYPLDKYEI